MKQLLYETLFGLKLIVGLSTGNVPQCDIIPQLQSEVDLMDLVPEQVELHDELDSNSDTSNSNTVTVVPEIHGSVLNESMDDFVQSESRTAPPDHSRAVTA